jgi:proteasome accessory factor C
VAGPERPERLERLTDLVLVLLHATRPLTLDALARAVPGYPEKGPARRQAFERDKKLLRDEGIPVRTEAVEGDEQFGYRIDPDDFYLPDLGLDPEEQAALHLAVAGVHLGDPSGRHALLKLGAAGLAEARPVAALDPTPHLAELFQAVRDRARLTFDYRGEPRHLSPAVLGFRQGRWYLAGFDQDREAARTFRVDRITAAPEAGPPGSGPVPDDFDPAAALPDEPVQPGEGGPLDVLVRVDATEGPRVVAEVGPGAVAEQDGDGSVLLRLATASVPVLRSWILGLLDHAEVVGPPEVRRDVLEWLASVAAQEPRPEPAGAPPPVPAPTPPAPAGRPDARARLRRLLAIVSWLAQVKEAPVEEVSRRFGVGQEELVAELELAACCGTPPYTPDTLMEIVVTDRTVSAFLPAELGRPRRLTPAEGFALAAAARTILAVPGADEHGALARALAKLEHALGGADALRVALDRPAHLEAVRRGVDEGRRLEIDYVPVSSTRAGPRTVDPIRLVGLEGHWYLDAEQAEGGRRRFRVDRITAVRDAGPRPGPAPAVEGPADEAFVPGPDAVAVQLSLGPGAAWVADSVPAQEVRTGPDGQLRVTLAVGGVPWLARLLLQAGPEARVLSPPPLVSVGPEAARRVLARYAPPH